MNQRLEKAIEGVIYWKKAYNHSRDKLRETGEEKYAVRMDLNYLHILSGAEWLRRVYEEETGEIVTTIGNLPEVQVLNESVY